MDTRNPSSSASSSHQWNYDVFLSFRGEDTRKGFTDHLFATLKQKGVNTFRDDKKLEKGKPISSELSQAIEESLFAIVVLSKNYASSTWCLDELVKIMECSKKMGSIVLPIFYDVNASVVRKQTGTYKKAFKAHEKHFQKNIGKVDTWRAALKDVANLSGWSLKDRPESEFIQDIVKMISHKLRYAFPRDTKGLVGVDSQVKKLMSHLAIRSNDVRIIGVWGMGGIGKTTLAKAVYWKVLGEFEGGCFITNVREVSENSGLLPLQRKLICDILMEENVNIRDIDDGVHMIKNRLCHKKVLLVLDDVNQFKQLEKLAGEPNWFGQGSRVIITTTDKRLLIRHQVYEIYEARELDDDDALRLFSLKAFNKDHPLKNYLEMSKHFVNYAKGLPLAIDVLGSFLSTRGKEEWESVLDRLKKFPEKDIMKILQISFDALQDTEKEIFLYIAHSFNMKDKDYTVKELDRLGLCPKIGLRVLIEKSLLKHCENTFWMHELLQIMCKNIVDQEPQKWSKILQYNDSHNALKKNMECEAIEGLVFELGDQHISEEAQLNLSDYKNLVEWPLSPSPEIWKQLPLSPSLERICSSDILDQRDCNLQSISGNQLSTIPKLIFRSSEFLMVLDLRDCHLQSIPSTLGCLFSLYSLHLGGNNFECLPESIIQLSKLNTIDLNDCMRLRSLPQLPSSTSLVGVANCNSLETLPNRLILDKLRQPPIYLFNCFKLAGNQGWSDMFFRMLTGDTQGIYEEPEIHSVATLSIVVPGSNIPRWFKPQNVGKMVIAQVVPSHLCNKWMGIAVCAVFSCHLLHSRKNCSMESCFLHCHIEVNKLESVKESAIFSYKFARIGSHHLWLLYFHPECFEENARAVLSQIEENKIIQMEVRFEDSDNSCLEVQKCGFRMVYEQDIEDFREMMAPHSKSCNISPYEGSDAQHDFDSSMVVKECSKIKRSHDNYNGAGPSGEGLSNDVPHSKEDSKIKGCLAHCSFGSLPIILLQGLVRVWNKLRNGLSRCFLVDGC